MFLDVQLFSQKEKSVDCGLACTSMILDYYGIKKGIEDLRKDIFVHEGMGIYLPQLGKYIIEQGFSVEIITLNPLLFVNSVKDLSQKDLQNYLQNMLEKTEKESLKKTLPYFLEFMKAGGILSLKIPNAKDIREEIEEKRPVGALLTSSFLLHPKADFNFHFNVVTGIDEKFIYVNDPMWDHRGGKLKFLIEDYIYGIHASAYGDPDNASIFKVRKL